MIGTAPRLWHYVVYVEDLEGEVQLAAVADTLLPSEQHVLVLAVVDRRIKVRALWYVFAGSYEAVVVETT